MESDELRLRTKQFALRIMRMVAALPKSNAGRVLGGQILRSGTSVGANYRAAVRARSRAEFISRLAIVVEEADECCYWLELIAEGKLLGCDRLADIQGEANELRSIFAASLSTARRKRVR